MMLSTGWKPQQLQRSHNEIKQNKHIMLLITYSADCRNTLWKAHDIEDPIELVMVIWIACLDVLLAAVKDRLGRHQFGKDAPNRPDI